MALRPTPEVVPVISTVPGVPGAGEGVAGMVAFAGTTKVQS